ncbi:MAG: hypothetical protein QM726_09030 [Chitinophagaceae bacterium]
MSNGKKIFLGILSFLPIVFFVIYMVTFFGFMINIFRHAQHDDVMPEMVMGNVFSIIAVALVMMLTTLGLLIYFIIHMLNNTMVEGIERIVWVLVFIFAGMIGFPVYWYMRIWKQAPAETIPGTYNRN